MAIEQPNTKRTPQQSILQITGQILPARCIAIVTEIEIAGSLAEKPQTIEELSEDRGIDSDSLFRVMRFLASIGIFHQESNGKFRNTSQSEVLRKDIPGSIYSIVRQGWQDLLWDTYKALPDSLVSGQPAFTIAHGSSFFSHLSKNPAHQEMFDTSMSIISEAENSILAETYDFGNAGLIIDLGGGKAGLLAAILHLHKDLKGILFDQAQVLVSLEAINEASLGDRCQCVSGDFFSNVPGDGDVYLLKRILHDWSDEDAIKILTSVRTAMPPKARIAVMDAVLEPGNSPDANKYMDLGIMTLLNGRERTKEEFEKLFSQSGLRMLNVTATRAPCTLSIIEGCLP